MSPTPPTGLGAQFNPPALTLPADSAPVVRNDSAEFCAHHTLVTFVIDDGWITDYTVKKPIFDAHRAVAVSAIISARRSLSDDRLREMQAAGWEIASHSRTHRDLTQLTEDELEGEIAGSKAELEAIGLRVNAFVFPYGLDNPHTRRMAREYYAVTARVGWGLNKWNRPNPLELGRNIFGTQYARPDQNSLQFYETQVDSARQTGRWLVYMVHELVGADAQHLNDLLDYINTHSIPIVTLTQGVELRRSCRPRQTTVRASARRS